MYLDSRSMLPRLVLAKDSGGELLERYEYREVRENPADLVAANSFDPGRALGSREGHSVAAGAGSGRQQPAKPGRSDDALTAKVTLKQADVAGNHRQRIGFSENITISLAMGCQNSVRWRRSILGSRRMACMTDS